MIRMSTTQAASSTAALHVPARFRELEREFAAASGAYVACERMNQLTMYELRFCRELIENNVHARARARVGVLVVAPPSDGMATDGASPLLLFFSATAEHQKTSWLRAELVRLLLLGGAHRIRAGEPCRVRRLALWLQMRLLTTAPKQISAQATYKYLQKQSMLEPHMQKPGNFLWLWKQVLQLTSKKLARLAQTLDRLPSDRHTVESWTRAPAPSLASVPGGASGKRKRRQDASLPSPPPPPPPSAEPPQMILHEQRMHVHEEQEDRQREEDNRHHRDDDDDDERPLKCLKVHTGDTAATTQQQKRRKASTTPAETTQRQPPKSQAHPVLHPPPHVKTLFRAHAAAMRKRISLFDDVVRRPSIRAGR
jgi:hypothetical protein